MEETYPKSHRPEQLFIICLSQAAVHKTGDEPGFVDDELNTAWEIAQAQSDTEFTIIPVRLEDCDRGDHRLSVYQQYDLFRDWEGVLDRLAVQLGGHSLAEKQAIDERTEDEKMIKRHEEALATYNKALAIDPDFALAWHIKGLPLEKLERYEEALHAFEKTLAIDPNSAMAFQNKQNLLNKLGRTD